MSAENAIAWRGSFSPVTVATTLRLPVSITDKEALDGFQLLCRTEGIIPALESSHAVAYAMKLAPTLRAEQHILVNLSGRGDKDIGTVADLSGVEFYDRPSARGQSVKGLGKVTVEGQS